MTTQAELTARQKEAYVRARWINVGPTESGCFWVDTDGSESIGQWKFFRDSSAAYDYTVIREKQIAEVKQEIAHMEELVEYATIPDEHGCYMLPQSWEHPMKRILTARQQALAELRRGMRCP